MVLNGIGLEVFKTAVNGVKGFKTNYSETGDMAHIIFTKENVQVMFYIPLGVGSITYKVFRNEQPVTKEKYVMAPSDVRDILSVYSEKRGEQE